MSAAETLLLGLTLAQRSSACAASIDERRFAQWPLFFTAQARYRVQGRENHARGLPLCLMDLESQAMMQDRVYGITQTIYHQPHYTRHMLGLCSVLEQSENSAQTEQSFAVFRTKPASLGEGVSEVFAVGRYLDLWVQTGGTWLLEERLCVLDSENILNSLIYPI